MFPRAVRFPRKGLVVLRTQHVATVLCRDPSCQIRVNNELLRDHKAGVEVERNANVANNPLAKQINGVIGNIRFFTEDDCSPAWKIAARRVMATRAYC